MLPASVARVIEARYKAEDDAAERSRLEREVIEAAKAYGRAARATEEHIENAQAHDSDAGWRLLRDMEATWECLMLEKVDALLDFESSQEKKG